MGNTLNNIAVRPNTYERFVNFAGYGESVDQAMNRLLKIVEKEKFIPPPRKGKWQGNKGQRRAGWTTKEITTIKMMGNKRPQTSLEIELQKFLDSEFPGHYEFVGDGKLWLGIKVNEKGHIKFANPDFAHNQFKLFIEAYGSYYHKPEDKAKRVALLEKGGFACLIIWDYELEDMKSLLQKVKEFHKSNGVSRTK